MTDIIFPSMEALDSVGRTHKSGFTDGTTIVINLYTSTYTEEITVKRISTAIIHEIIHCMDMNLTERQVLYITMVLFEELYI